MGSIVAHPRASEQAAKRQARARRRVLHRLRAAERLLREAVGIAANEAQLPGDAYSLGFLIEFVRDQAAGVETKTLAVAS